MELARRPVVQGIPWGEESMELARRLVASKLGPGRLGARKLALGKPAASKVGASRLVAHRLAFGRTGAHRLEVERKEQARRPVVERIPWLEVCMELARRPGVQGIP
jgi:hypothetical protein